MPLNSNSTQLMEMLEKLKPAFEKRALTLSEAANYIGLSKSSLYKFTHKKQVPHFKPRGKMIYFNREDLDVWLLKNRISTTDEIEAKAIKYISGKVLGAKC